MNIIRFNEPFEAAIKTWPKENEPDCPFKDWEKTPLFQYFCTRNKEKTMLDGMIKSGVRLEAADWPFETFRLSLSQHAPGGWEESGIKVGHGTYRVNYVVTRRNEQISYLAHVVSLYDETPGTLAYSRRYAPLVVCCMDAHSTFDPEGDYRFRTMIFAGGRWMQGKLEGHIIEGTMDSLAGFLIDSTVPTNHIAQVRPDEPTRSVEWVQARTHYTLITHGHPANQKTVKEGQRVRVDTGKELTRMAGNRIGHYKHLRHPRFKYARNEKRYPDKPPGTIFVKPCWCGPKEWRDEGGKQIYKILEQIDENQQAA